VPARLVVPHSPPPPRSVSLGPGCSSASARGGEGGRLLGVPVCFVVRLLCGLLHTIFHNTYLNRTLIRWFAY
jgi:hypothetical protein